MLNIFQKTNHIPLCATCTCIHICLIVQITKKKNYDSLTKSNEAFGLYKTFSFPGPHACLKRQLNVGVPSDGISEMRLSQHVWHYKDPSLPKR